MTEEHKAYEETPEFKAYWAAVQAATPLRAAAQFRNVRSPEFQALKAAESEIAGLLALTRATPEHKAAFGW